MAENQELLHLMVHRRQEHFDMSVGEAQAHGEESRGCHLFGYAGRGFIPLRLRSRERRKGGHQPEPCSAAEHRIDVQRSIRARGSAGFDELIHMRMAR